MAIHSCKYEERWAKVEGDTKVNNNSINNLIKTLDRLTGEVKWLIRLSFTTMIAGIGFLVSQIVKG